MYVMFTMRMARAVLILVSQVEGLDPEAAKRLVQVNHEIYRIFRYLDIDEIEPMPEPAHYPCISFDENSKIIGAKESSLGTESAGQDKSIEAVLNARHSEAITREEVTASNSKQSSTWADIAALPKRKALGPARKLDIGVGPNKAAEQRFSYNESSAQQQRVVLVHGLRKGMTLREVTEKISQGALVSVKLENDAKYPPMSARIIFQYSSSATYFLEANALEVQRSGHSPYGPGVTVSLGGLWSDKDIIQAMEPSENKRRRLTFSMRKMFLRTTRDKLIEDMTQLVGEENIEMVFKFDGGTATAILSSVEIADKARRHFQHLAKQKGRYEGVKVDFSSDPCEKELQWMAQMHHGP